MKLSAKIKSTVIAFSITFLLLNTNAFGQEVLPNLPGMTEPGVASRILTQEQAAKRVMERPVAPETQLPVQPTGTLGPAAEKITFDLHKVTITGNCVYSTAELSKLWKAKLNKTISVAEFMKIVQDITNYYRNNGYILSRAVLPPQKIKGGQVKIRVIEGFIDNVKVVTKCEDKKAECILMRYGYMIKRCRPLKISTLEYYLRLSNELAGMRVKGVLEPSKTTTGASDLNLVVEDYKHRAGYFSFDNYGTRYIGPNQITTDIGYNGLLTGGDYTDVTYITTSRPKELKYLNGQYTLPIGCQGLKFTGGGNTSETHPGLNLRPLEIQGNSTTYFGYFSYPLLREKTTDMNLNWGGDYLDSQVTALDQLLYIDHIRSLQLGFDLNHSDKCKGTSFVVGTFRQGLPILGATHNTLSLTTSRFGASGRYSKFNLALSRLQTLNKHLTGFVIVKGQYAFNPLLASEQYTVGGSILGRGYDPAEIIGDRGASGSAELRCTINPGWKFLNMVQPYGFYDYGVIWNIRNLRPAIFKKQSIASTGFGVRFVIIKNIFGNLMIAQPLTKKVLAEEIVGRGKALRGFFSITAML